jgi:hypothetical protein
VTGEERVREHTAHLYGAIMSWEGRPTDYQLARIDILGAELAAIAAEFDTLLRDDLARINDELAARGLQRIDIPDTVTLAQVNLGSPRAVTALRAAFTLQ